MQLIVAAKPTEVCDEASRKMISLSFLRISFFSCFNTHMVPSPFFKTIAKLSWKANQGQQVLLGESGVLIDVKSFFLSQPGISPANIDLNH